MDSAQELYNEGLNQGWNQITVRDSDDLLESIKGDALWINPSLSRNGHDILYQPATMPSIRGTITQLSSSTVIGTGWIGMMIDIWDIGPNPRRRSLKEQRA